MTILFYFFSLILHILPLSRLVLTWLLLTFTDLPCLALSYINLSSLVLCWLVLSCLVLTYLVLSCFVLFCLALSSVLFSWFLLTWLDFTLLYLTWLDLTWLDLTWLDFFLITSSLVFSFYSNLISYLIPHTAGIYSDLIPNCVIPVSPDAVLILWDSDVSDVNEDDLDTQGKTELRSAYQLNLIKAIDLLVKTGDRIIKHKT